MWGGPAIIVDPRGSLCVVFCGLVWLGTGSLPALTAAAMLLANDFWNVFGSERIIKLGSLFEHPGLIADFVAVM